MFTLSKEMNSNSLNPSDESFICYTGQADFIYFDDDKKQYYKLTANFENNRKSKRVYFDDNCFYSHCLTDKDCYGTYVYADGEECQKWAKAVLDTNNDVDFTNFLKTKNGDFFNIAVTSLRKMHPVMAVQILKKFGFRKYCYYDEKAGTELYKIESVEHWLKHVVQNDFYVIKSEVENLLKSHNGYKLKMYLTLICEYVNCNPGIINKNYKGCSDNQTIHAQPGYFQVPEDAAKLGLAEPSKSRKEEMLFSTTQSYNVIASTAIGIIETFKDKGKPLPAEIQNELEKKIRKYKVMQDELVKTLCYIDNYINAMDKNSQPTSLPTMEKIGERLSKLTGKELMNNLTGILLEEVDDSEHKPI